MHLWLAVEPREHLRHEAHNLVVGPRSAELGDPDRAPVGDLQRLRNVVFKVAHVFRRVVPIIYQRPHRSAFLRAATGAEKP